MCESHRMERLDATAAEVLPSGVVTLLFTDIEGSTKLIRSLPPEVSLETYEQHNRVLRSVFQKHGGYEQRTEGDSYFIVFQNATDAVAAAVDVQRALAEQTWPSDVPIRVRIGMHTGEPTPFEGDYFGIDVHRAARISSAGHGGQVLLSRTTLELAELPEGVTVKDLGEHRLKDLEQPEWVIQLVIDGLDQEFPPLNSLETPSNLPVDTSALVGREAEMAGIDELLARPDVRLVTITGPGGTGKTRLALAVARRQAEAFRNGLVFVDLAGVAEASEVPTAIEQALELTSSTQVSTLENVVASLRNRAVLLVLDNFEHVADAAGDVATLLAGTHRVKVIATSRSALRIAAEREFPLQPLAASRAIELFVERASAVKPAFALTPETQRDIAEICERLDCLPLAIELAAARVRALTPAQIKARLGGSLGLLVGGARDLPSRQQTLRDTIAWSYELLSPDAAATLRRASVFAGGATLEALEAVADGDPDTFVNVEVLLDQSLMRQDADSGRFHLLATIREYAAEQASVLGETYSLAEKHAEYFTELASQADAGLRGEDGTTWRRRLDEEQPNLRAALEWVFTPTCLRNDLAVRLATELSWYWYMHGRAVEGSEWLRQARRRVSDEPVAFRGKLAHRLGVLLDQRADKAGAAEALREAAELARESGNRREEARALNSLASALRVGGSTEEPRRIYEQALEIRTELGDQSGISATTYNLGLLAMDDGDYEKARELCARSRDVDHASGDDWGEAIGAVGVASADLELGQVVAARPLLRQAMAVFVEYEDDDHIAEVLSVLAAEAGVLGQFERCARLAGAADALWRRINIPLAAADQVHFERHQAPARAALGDEAFERSFQEGASMTTSQAVAYGTEDAG